jgi:membrane-bound ClpP family serine protease
MDMNPLLDPNVAYVILVLGFFLAVMALFTPGTGLLELGALSLLVIAGFSIVNLPFNLWALALLIFGLPPLLYYLRKTGKTAYLIAAIAVLEIGSIFIFRAESGILAVHPLLAAVTGGVLGVLIWIIARRALEAINLKPSLRENFTGEIGEARTSILLEGSVYVGGENWTARSKTRIPDGSLVRVTGREGLVLLVEPVETEQKKSKTD